ncbi:N-acetyltransferase YodP [Marinithermofilum abyssi]|uniref:N-acetyltransferase YodP n=1 Tax=Marinithermofilum abyssi TaxID=1571185 RepID=A0A8J2VDW7_9BACL|nr:putative beta-lysine N-acetyltransferase [Marinithermofilum abyssi]GGE03561.1 N-acetyltransferase YodP [Marinithermofilum abyssi]
MNQSILTSVKELESCKVEVDPHNSRVKLLEYPKQEVSRLSRDLVEEAEEKQLGKVIVYAREQDVEAWKNEGFRLEGTIDGFFNGDSACMMANFVEKERALSEKCDELDRIVKLAEQTKKIEQPPELPAGYALREAQPEDVPELARLYRQVFTTYPTPIHHEDDIRRAMEDDVYFSVVTHEEWIVSASSADVFPEYQCAELTDCATDPQYRGKGLVSALFSHLEQKLSKMGIGHAFSLTRAISAGMNIVAAKHGYRYRGRLVQNCEIAGGFEDMNIWVKAF